MDLKDSIENEVAFILKSAIDRNTNQGRLVWGLILTLLTATTNAGCALSSNRTTGEQLEQIDVRVIDPKDAAGYTLRCGVYGSQNQPEKALLDCNKAIEIDGSFSPAYFTRGFLFLTIGEYSNAVSDLTIAIYLNKKRLRQQLSNDELRQEINSMSFSYVNRGFAHVRIFEKNNQQTELDNAIDDYNKALELKPADTFTLSTGYSYRCQAYMAKFRGNQSPELLVKALSDINRAIALNPDNPAYYEHRSKVYLAKNDDAKALIDFQKCEQLQKNKK